MDRVRTSTGAEAPQPWGFWFCPGLQLPPVELSCSNDPAHPQAVELSAVHAWQGHRRFVSDCLIHAPPKVWRKLPETNCSPFSRPWLERLSGKALFWTDTVRPMFAQLHGHLQASWSRFRKAYPPSGNRVLRQLFCEPSSWDPCSNPKEAEEPSQLFTPFGHSSRDTGKPNPCHV